jgi:hypothetical protein
LGEGFALPQIPTHLGFRIGSKNPLCYRLGLGYVGGDMARHGVLPLHRTPACRRSLSAFSRANSPIGSGTGALGRSPKACAPSGAPPGGSGNVSSTTRAVARYGDGLRRCQAFTPRVLRRDALAAPHETALPLLACLPAGVARWGRHVADHWARSRSAVLRRGACRQVDRCFRLDTVVKAGMPARPAERQSLRGWGARILVIFFKCREIVRIGAWTTLLVIR